LAIIELLGDGGVGRPQRRQVVCDPAGSAAAEGIDLAQEIGAANPVHRLAGRRRRMGKTMARSSNVAGRRPMSAIMRAPQVENSRGSCPAYPRSSLDQVNEAMAALEKGEVARSVVVM
jgi:hypothetical protein